MCKLTEEEAPGLSLLLFLLLFLILILFLILLSLFSFLSSLLSSLSHSSLPLQESAPLPRGTRDKLDLGELDDIGVSLDD